MGAKNLVSQKAVIELLGFDQGNYIGQKKTGSRRETLKNAKAALEGNVQAGGQAKKQAAGSIGLNTKGAGDGVIRVEYNPKTLHFSASAEEETQIDQERSQKTITAVCKITLQAELIFYAKDSTDESVEEQIDLFLYLMKKNTGREIRFSWGNIAFEGVAHSVSAEYNMFDSYGKPVSGKVSLSIQGKSSQKLESKIYDNMDKARKDKITEESLA